MYCLNTNLQPGDIVLLRSLSKASGLIAAIARGRTTKHFSHAALYVGTGMLIEAMPHGVSRLGASRVIVQDCRNIAVLRLSTGQPEFDLEVALKAARLAVKHETQPYAFKRAAMSIVGAGKPRPTEGVFCSHLIAKCFRQAGLALVSYPDHRVTPNRLHESLYLRNVSADTLNPTRLDGESDEPPIDGHDSHRPIAKFSRRLVKLVRGANRLLASSGLEPVSDLPALLARLATESGDPRIRAVDAHFSELVHDADLADFLRQFWRMISEEEEDVQERTRRLISQRLITVSEARKELPMLRHLVQHKRQVYSEYCGMRDALNMGYQLTGLKTFHALYAFYYQLCLAYTTHGAPFEIALTELSVYVENDASQERLEN